MKSVSADKITRAEASGIKCLACWHKLGYIPTVFWLPIWCSNVDIESTNTQSLRVHTEIRFGLIELLAPNGFCFKYDFFSYGT